MAEENKVEQKSGETTVVSLEDQVRGTLAEVYVGFLKNRELKAEFVNKGLFIQVTYRVMSDAHAGNKALEAAGFKVEKSKDPNVHVFNVRPAPAEKK